MAEGALETLDRATFVNSHVIWGHYLRKMTVADIARKKRMTVAEVEAILEQKRREYHGPGREMADGLTKEHLSTLDYIIGEAALAWEKSKCPTTSTTRGEVWINPTDGTLIELPAVKVTRQRCGDEVHFQTMMKAMAEQRKILCPDAARIDVTLVNDDSRAAFRLRVEELAAKSAAAADGLDEPTYEGALVVEPQPERALLDSDIAQFREKRKQRRVETLQPAVRADVTTVGHDLGDGGEGW